jgi:hypothetical protein
MAINSLVKYECMFSFIQKTAITAYPCSQTSVEIKKLRTCNIQGKIFMYQLYLHKYKKKQALQSQFATRIIFLKMYHPPYKGFCIMLMPTKQSEGEHTILLALFIHK